MHGKYDFEKPEAENYLRKIIEDVEPDRDVVAETDIEKTSGNGRNIESESVLNRKSIESAEKAGI